MLLEAAVLAVPFHNKIIHLIFVQGQWKIVFQFLPNNNINTICVPYYKTMELPFVEQKFPTHSQGNTFFHLSHKCYLSLQMLDA